MITPTTTLRMAWGGSILSKAVYYMVFINAINAPGYAPQAGSEALIFLGAMGIFTAFLGIIFASLLRGRTIFTNRVMRHFTGAQGEDLIAIHFPKYFNLCIISMGMTETAAIFGMVGAMQTGSQPFMLGMTTVAAIGWLFTYPRLHEDISLIENKI